MKFLHPDELDQAVNLLKDGIPVAFPTETVYGLGARVFDEAGIRSIFRMKGRPSDNPLICHIESLDQLILLAKEIPPEALTLAAHFWPGPLTVVLKKQAGVPSGVTGGLETIAIRMPRHPIALKLIQKAGQPLAAPSANRSGKPSSTTAEHVFNDFKEFPGAVIDGGPTEIGLESTVIFLAGERPQILRPGSISQEALEEILKCQIQDAQEIRASPGTRYRHYAPKAKLTLLRSWVPITQSPKRFYMSTEKREGFHQATPANLYALLRQADDENYEEVIVVCEEGWKQIALRDRLLRASCR